MARIDEIKAHIDWKKDLFKILVAILVADIAGVAKLYLEHHIDVLFYIGIVFIIILSFWLGVIAKKIEKHIIELGEL